jgi:hypothetical protein
MDVHKSLSGCLKQHLDGKVKRASDQHHVELGPKRMQKDKSAVTNIVKRFTFMGSKSLVSISTSYPDLYWCCGDR